MTSLFILMATPPLCKREGQNKPIPIHGNVAEFRHYNSLRSKNTFLEARQYIPQGLRQSATPPNHWRIWLEKMKPPAFDIPFPQKQCEPAKPQARIPFNMSGIPTSPNRER